MNDSTRQRSPSWLSVPGISFPLLVSLVMTAAMGQERLERYPVDQDGKWGFIDKTGHVVITPSFDEVYPFTEGCAAVRVDDRFGFIDGTGKWLVPPRFGYTPGFSEGLAWVERPDAGFVDKTGKVVARSPSGTYCRRFREGLARTMRQPPRRSLSLSPEKRSVGFIDKMGDYKIKPQFDAAWDFKEGFAAVEIDKKWGFINRAGEFTIRPQYRSAHYFSEGLAAVMVGNKIVFVDPSGKRALPTEYDNAHGFREGLAGAKRNNRWGFIDKAGRWKIEPQFDEVGSFAHGRASIVVDHKYGYIDRQGNVVIEPRYAYGHAFSGELAGVTFYPARGDGAGTGYINRAGKVIWEPEPNPAIR